MTDTSAFRRGFMTPKQRKIQARVAALTRFQPGSPELAEARQEYVAANVEEHAREVARQFPNLTPAQRGRIAGMLRPIVSDDGMAASA